MDHRYHLQKLILQEAVDTAMHRLQMKAMGLMLHLLG